MSEKGAIGDLTVDELRAIVATVIKMEADAVEDFLLIVKQPCDQCGRDYCGDGPLATVSSRGATRQDGSLYHEPAFELHLAAKLIESMAEQWADETGSRT